METREHYVACACVLLRTIRVHTAQMFCLRFRW